MSTAEKQTAFEYIEPKLPSIRARVLDTVSNARKGVTAKQIAIAIGAKVHTVTGRLDELQDAGKVYGVVGEGRTETRYFAEDDEKRQRKFAESRRSDKFFSDFRKWQNRYSDILSKDTFARIEAEAERNFRVRTVKAEK